MSNEENLPEVFDPSTVPIYEPEVVEEIPGPVQTEWYMTYFTRYDGTNGRVLYVGNCSNTELEIHKTHGPTLEGLADPSLDYVILTGDEPVIAKRPSMDIVVMGLVSAVHQVPADGETELVIGHVPSGTLVLVEGPATMSGVTTGDDVELVFSLVGDYTVTLTNFPYNEEKVRVHAS